VRRSMLSYVAGAALIATAAMLGVTSFMDREAEMPVSVPEKREPPFATAVVARKAINRGEAIKSEDVTSIGVDRGVSGKIAKSTADVIGAIALQTIAPGQFVGEFNASQSPGAREGLALMIPDGMRAVALRISDDIAVGNFVRPGDRVDVLIRIAAADAEGAAPHGQSAGAPRSGPRESNLLLQNVEVLSIGQALNPSSNVEALRAQTVTVAVTPTDASRLNLTAELGSFYLALRNPRDKKLVEVQPIRRANLLDPEAPAEQRSKKGEGTRPHRMRIISGGSISHVPTEDAGK